MIHETNIALTNQANVEQIETFTAHAISFECNYVICLAQPFVNEGI